MNGPETSGDFLDEVAQRMALKNALDEAALRAAEDDGWVMEPTTANFRQDDDGNLHRVPDPPVVHSPMIGLYYNKKLVGFRCGHCFQYYTPSGKPSGAFLEKYPPHKKPGRVRVAENKAHSRRVQVVVDSILAGFRMLMPGGLRGDTDNGAGQDGTGGEGSSQVRDEGRGEA